MLAQTVLFSKSVTTSMVTFRQAGSVNFKLYRYVCVATIGCFSFIIGHFEKFQIPVPMLVNAYVNAVLITYSVVIVVASLKVDTCSYSILYVRL